MRNFIRAGVLALALSIPSALAATEPATQEANGSERAYREMREMFGLVPSFFRAYPTASIAGAWDEYRKVLLSSNTSIPPKYKELIGLAVASQIPCEFCAYAHDKFARMNGADGKQMMEAVAISAQTRQWSTFFNGMQLDDAAFRRDVDRVFTKSDQPPPGEVPTQVQSTDPSARIYADIQKKWGFVPGFMEMVPKHALSGFWQDFKTLELEQTSIPAKYKSLIGLAVAGQVPCRYRVYFDSKGARAEGATEAEIQEAVTVASLTRKWSTVLNGMQISQKKFRSEINRMATTLKQKTTKQLGGEAAFEE